MARKKKYILELDKEIDFDVIGICSHHGDYRLAWSINDTIGLNLRKCEEDFVLSNKSGKITSSHSAYEFKDEEYRLDYFLIKNKSKGSYLIQEKTTIDYFLFLCDNTAVEVDALIQRLKTAPSILAAYRFYSNEIASAENLVFI
jgi:hypothetical protein